MKKSIIAFPRIGSNRELKFALGAIPGSYKNLELSELDTLFALARGFQDEQNDVKARPMKKWFNTNYHYLVPEINKDTIIKANFSKLLNEYKEAKSAGFETRPTIIGPYTFLVLADYKSGATKDTVLSDVIVAFQTLLKELNQLGVEWLQIEEPALVLDQTEEEKNYL